MQEPIRSSRLNFSNCCKLATTGTAMARGRAAPHAHQCTFGRAEERGMRCFLGNALPACRELLKTFSVESLLRRTLSAFGGKADIQLIPFDVCF